MFTRRFWADAAERAIKTLFQSLGVYLVALTTNLAWDPQQFILLVVLPPAISLCMSVAGTQVGNKGTASWTPKSVDPSTPPGTPGQ